MSSREYKRDLRWLASIALSLTGAVVALTTRWLNGDSWHGFGVTAVYSIAWALITFAVLYLVAKAFEHWEWGREDHDLVRKLDKAKVNETSTRRVTDHPLVREVFDDPRYKHLGVFADYTDPEAENLDYDRVMTLQALAAVYTLRSAERQGKVMARATWALVAATVGLVAVTLVLVVVTMEL